jgi:hypothetical protein
LTAGNREAEHLEWIELMNDSPTTESRSASREKVLSDLSNLYRSLLLPVFVLGGVWIAASLEDSTVPAPGPEKLCGMFALLLANIWAYIRRLDKTLRKAIPPSTEGAI